MHCRSLASSLAWLLLAAPALAAPPAFQEPPSLSSEAGVLALTLEAGPSQVTIKGKDVLSNVYNGLYVPPLLRLQHGDVLEVHQVNSTSSLQLNFHSHGVITSPLANGDNVVGVRVLPGESFDTSIAIADENSSGMYWYHTHVHGYVNDGISNGLAGALIIGDVLESFPSLA